MDKGVELMFDGRYQGRRVLVTGHSGFKGSWLVFWLQRLGATVCGCSLPPPTDPSHWDLLKLDVRSEWIDIRDEQALKQVFSDFQPEIVFHLAAQPLVRLSYLEPATTFDVNVLGTVRVLDACRHCSSVRAIVNITSDKCYENRESIWGYREDDPMGGYDPYSASKGCAELVANSYRRSFFNLDEYGAGHSVLMASCRAGNVIGGGDWAVDRLVPDMMRATASGKVVQIRNPNATRPWQHVLEPISGYLQIAQKLLAGQTQISGSWNLGPADEGALTVGQVVERAQKFWPELQFQLDPVPGPHEACLLKLDITKARKTLYWNPVWDCSTALKRTVDWYRSWYQSSEVQTADDLSQYVRDAKEQHSSWADESEGA